MRQQAGMAVTRMQARCRTVGAAAGKYGSNQDTSQMQQSQTSWVRIKRANQVQGSRQADSQGQPGSVQAEFSFSQDQIRYRQQNQVMECRM
ncbi:unnamed protein product, partial [Staurois parvus]